MEKLFVSYELAVIAKENGFNEPCLGVFEILIEGDKTAQFRYNRYDRYAEDITEGTFYNHNGLNQDWKCSAPMHQQLIDWFREKHKMWISISFHGDSKINDKLCNCYFTINSEDDDESYGIKHLYKSKEYDDYYEALNKSLEEAFKLI